MGFFPVIFKPTAPLSLSAEMGFSVGIMDMQISPNVSTRPSKCKYLHTHLQMSSSGAGCNELQT